MLPGGILSRGHFVRGAFCPGGIMSWIPPPQTPSSAPKAPQFSCLWHEAPYQCTAPSRGLGWWRRCVKRGLRRWVLTENFEKKLALKRKRHRKCYRRNEWQSIDQIVGFYYYVRKNIVGRPHTEWVDNSVVDWCRENLQELNYTLQVRNWTK